MWFELFVVVLIGLIGFLIWLREHKLMYHFKVVEPGRLYRSGTLSLKALQKVHKKYHINTIINLRLEKERKRSDWYEVESQFCNDHNIQLINIPMLYNATPQAEQVKQFLDITLPPADNIVLVHCEIGSIRTGMMVMAYLKHRLNRPNQEILNKLPFFGHSIEKTYRQQVKEFLLNYHPDYFAK